MSCSNWLWSWRYNCAFQSARTENFSPAYFDRTNTRLDWSFRSFHYIRRIAHTSRAEKKKIADTIDYKVGRRSADAAGGKEARDREKKKSTLSFMIYNDCWLMTHHSFGAPFRASTYRMECAIPHVHPCRPGVPPGHPIRITITLELEMIQCLSCDPSTGVQSATRKQEFCRLIGYTDVNNVTFSPDFSITERYIWEDTRAWKKSFGFARASINRIK